MADSLQSFIEQARLSGVQLAGAPRKELTKAIQQPGKKGQGKIITAAEIRGGKKTYEKAGGTDYLSTVGRTYAAEQLAKDLRKKFETKGYTRQGGYYVKPGDITGSVLEKVKAAGYGEEDIRSTLASGFAKATLDEEVAKFLGKGEYTRDPNTGTWSKKPTITVTGSGTIPPITSVPTGTVSGIYAGIDPDAAKGKTIAEIEYMTEIDPYRIQAKSAERRARMEQATDLTKSRMQQANYLYNLIPSAF